MTPEELDIKMKEDALKLKQSDITDTLKSIESEHIKSSLVLVFAATLFGVVMDKLESLPVCAALLFSAFLLIAVGIALYNIAAKPVPIYTNLDDLISGEKKPLSWNEYITFKYKHLSEAFTKARKLLADKAKWTKRSFIFLAASLLLLIIFQFIYGTTQSRHERGYERANWQRHIRR